MHNMVTVKQIHSEQLCGSIQMIKKYIKKKKNREWLRHVSGTLQALRSGAKMFICTAASELSVQSILEPNKITQLSNLKPRLAVKKKQYFKWMAPTDCFPLFSAPARLYNTQSHNVGKNDVVKICSHHLGYTSIAYITVCRATWIQHTIHWTLSARELCLDSFTASLNWGPDTAWPLLVSPGVTLCSAIKQQSSCAVCQHSNIIISRDGRAWRPMHHLRHFVPFTHQRL